MHVAFYPSPPIRERESQKRKVWAERERHEERGGEGVVNGDMLDKYDSFELDHDTTF